MSYSPEVFEKIREIYEERRKRAEETLDGHMRQVRSIPGMKKIEERLGKTGLLVTAEEVCAAGCIGTVLSSLAAEKGIRFRSRLLNLGEGIVVHGGRAQLLMDHGVDAESVAGRAEQLFRERGDA